MFLQFKSNNFFGKSLKRKSLKRIAWSDSLRVIFFLSKLLKSDNQIRFHAD